MPILNSTAASLRIFGDDLDPDEITRLLGRTPSHAEKKGELVTNQGGKQRVARRGRWAISTIRRQPGDLDSQIAELLEGLTDDLSVWEDLAARYKIDIFCGLFILQDNEGISLSSRSLRLPGERGILLGLDIYAAKNSAPEAS